MSLPALQFDELTVEKLTDECREAYEEASWAYERAIDKAVNFGRLLCIAKSKIPHGGWSKWVADTFESQASLRSIQRFMQLAESNATNPSLLEGVKTLDEALGLVQVKRVPKKPEPEAEASEELQVNESRMLEETTAAHGQGDGIAVVVEPSVHEGYAFLSILIGNECVWLKRPIHREAIPELIAGELPAGAQLSWEFTENAERVNHALFAIT